MTNCESRQDMYQVQLNSGELISYQIRGLRNDDNTEITQWATFCASVFSYKPNPPPPSYFERHYYNDPTRVASLIRVAIWNNEIVASCRLFLRTISSNGNKLSAGGIGEVCTSKDHQRRGLSKILLQNVIEIMKERQIQVSMLHAAPVFFPVYEKAGGYVCSTSRWSLVPITTSQLTATAQEISRSCSCLVRPASFPKDVDRLSQLHGKFSEERFAGCIVRSKDYWNSYLSQELQGSLWVLECSNTIVAWLSLRPRGDRIQLREFGFDLDQDISHSLTLHQSLSVLLCHAVQDLSNTASNSPTSVEGDWLLTLPSFLLAEDGSTSKDEALPFVQWDCVKSDDDMGWMYKILDGSIPISAIDGSQQPHLIWPSDSF